MKKQLQEKLSTLFDLTTDLAVSLDESQYQTKLADVRSNTVGGQLWCVLGARESYLKQLQVGGEFDFKCSVRDKHNKLQILKALHKSAANISQYTHDSEIPDREAQILLDIIQHESQHHGQLIRYVYGNNWQFPDSWNGHYTV